MSNSNQTICRCKDDYILEDGMYILPTKPYCRFGTLCIYQY